jgi:hypothetical protein
MSLGRELAAVGQMATAPFEEEDLVTNLRTGKTFAAKVQPFAEFELDTTQGRDARESITVHVRDRAAAADIRPGDELATLGSKFAVLRREDNPATLHVEFRCMKIVPEKDS